MEKKKFNRGTMTGGIVRIIISCIGIFVGSIVLKSAIKSWDAEDASGNIFMCFIAGIIFIAGIAFIINGIKMIIDGEKSIQVVKKGHSEQGKILDLVATEVTETNNGCVSHYTIYTLKFEYNDDNGNLCESEEQINQNAYDKLQKRKLVPILVYKERAVFDRKSLENK